jgi:hypothetical protein
MSLIEMTSSARSRLPCKAAVMPNRAPQSADVVEQAPREPGGCPIRLAGQMHHARLGLYQQVVTRADRFGRVEGLDAHVHQARIDRVAPTGIDSERRCLPGTKVLDEHVCPFEQRCEDPTRGRLAEIEPEVPLVPIDGSDHRADTVGHRL